MRIVLLDPSCFTRLYTHNLCQALEEQGCEVHSVASQFLYLDHVEVSTYKKWDHFYGFTTRLYRRSPRGFLRRYVKGVEHIINMFTLPRFLKSLNPDIIHYQQAPLPLFDRFMLGRLKKIATLVSTVHNTQPFHSDAGWIQLAGFNSYLSQFEHLIVDNEYSRSQLLTEFNIADERISVIQGGPYDHYDKLLGSKSVTIVRQADPSDQKQTILFFGNISHYKGLDVLIRAYGSLPKKWIKKTRLLVCGNPQIPMDPIMSLAKEFGIETQISWDLRYIPEEEVHGIFLSSDIVVLPHRHIDRSGVLSIAIKYGNPIVASRIGGFAEILKDGKHGYLVAPEDPLALAKALEGILSDSIKSIKMGNAVRELGEEWISWDSVAKETIQLYKDLQEGLKR